MATLPSMSRPSEACQKAPSVTRVIATYHGTAISNINPKPPRLQSRRAVVTSRRTRQSAASARTTTIGPSGPLTRSDTPSAAQNTNRPRPGSSCRARAMTAMATATVASKVASVLARCASIPSMTEAASATAASSAPSGPISRRPIAWVAATATSAAKRLTSR